MKKKVKGDDEKIRKIEKRKYKKAGKGIRVKVGMRGKGNVCKNIM